MKKKEAVIKVYFQQLEHAEGLPLPHYETAGSSGCDLRAALTDPVTLQPGKRALIPTGLRMALPAGFEAQIRPRSGLAYRNGVTMLNTPGTIDSDYRGEIKVLAINLGDEDFVVKRGDRIAQMIIAPIHQIEIKKVIDLPKTERGDGGFGSTGVH